MTMVKTRDVKPYRRNDTSSHIKNDHATTDLRGTEDKFSFHPHKHRHRLYRIFDQFSQLPLTIKLIGPNIAILTAVCFMYVRYERTENSRAALLVALITLALGLSANYLLFFLNLRSIREVERATQLIWSGNQRTRVTEALLDSQMFRIGRTVNLLLDNLAANRVRTRSLVEQVVRTGDMERAIVTRKLYESTTHVLDSVAQQIEIASKYAGDPNVTRPLDVARDSIRIMSQGLNVLVQTTAPDNLEEHGLLAALQSMVDTMRTLHTVPIHIVCNDGDDNVLRLPSTSASVLYRVSHEAIRNALQHAMCTQINVTLEIFQTYATVQVVDDGVGFDIAQVVRDDRYLGLYTLRENVGLVDGEFRVTSAPNEGTTVYARVPVKGEINS